MPMGGRGPIRRPWRCLQDTEGDQQHRRGHPDLCGVSSRPLITERPPMISMVMNSNCLRPSLPLNWPRMMPPRGLAI